MFIAAMYVWKRFVQIFHRWLKELGSLNGSNGSSGARSIFAITDTTKERCDILVANIILKYYRKKPGSIQIPAARGYAILSLFINCLTNSVARY